jgi:hypothetical protein
MGNLESAWKIHFGSNAPQKGKINPVKEIERGKKVTQRVI